MVGSGKSYFSSVSTRGDSVDDRRVHQFTDWVVVLLIVGLLTIPGISGVKGWREIEANLEWGSLMLMIGGFAMGVTTFDSGLASWIAQHTMMPFAKLPMVMSHLRSLCWWRSIARFFQFTPRLPSMSRSLWPSATKRISDTGDGYDCGIGLFEVDPSWRASVSY